jgi:hypothetical protein
MSVGTYQVTADGQAGPARAVRVFNIVAKSSGTACVVSVKNGTTTGGTEYDQINGTINQAVIRNYEGGLVFPAGCFIDLDVNTSYVTVSLEVLGV